MVTHKTKHSEAIHGLINKTKKNNMRSITKSKSNKCKVAGEHVIEVETDFCLYNSKTKHNHESTTTLAHEIMNLKQEYI